MSSSTAVAKATAPASPATPVLLTVSVMLATIMQALDTTIANVADMGEMIFEDYETNRKKRIK